MNTTTCETVRAAILDAVVGYKPGGDVAYALTLPVTHEDRAEAVRCAERHEHNNRRFAHQAKFYRGKGHFGTIVRGYLGEIVIRRALGAPCSVDDLVFDKPQKRPDLLELDGHRLRLDMKTTEDGIARINQESHLNGAKRPFAYLIADIRSNFCHVFVAEAEQVDVWAEGGEDRGLKSHPTAHYWIRLPAAPGFENP